MKQLLTALLVFMTACLPASAAINASGRMFPNNPRFIPQGLCLNNKTILYIAESEDTEFTILNDEFNEISKFSTPSYPEVTEERTVSRALNGPINVYVVSTDNSEWWRGDDTTKENLAAECAQNGFSKTENRGNETWYLPDDQYRYYYYDVYGSKYPEQVYIWDNGANKGFERQFNYSYESWGFTGLYGDPETYSVSVSPSPSYIYPMDSNCNEQENLIISQTLFNSDESFEWIVPIIEAVNYSDINEYYKEEGKRLECTGFRVESQNGSVIATVKYPNGLYGNYQDGPYLYILDNKKYLFFEFHNKDYTESYYMAYEVDASNVSVNAIDAPRRIKVTPTLPQRGTDVNISFDNPTDSNCKVIVTSVSGKIVLVQNVQPGVTSATINTHHFEKGMYIVSVSKDGISHENTKIVVR